MLVKIRPLLELTTPLKDIPEWWLRIVEPKIERVDLCWLWQGAHGTNGEPIINIKMHKGYKTVQLKKLVAQMFYELKPYYDIFHRCGNLSCLNPSHLEVSVCHYSQEDREQKIAAFQRNLRDYVNRKSK
jgi:hypothetical protein